MGRENCNTYDLIGDNSYCAYFDYGCFECHKINNCPDGLDDDDDDYDAEVDFYEEY